MGQTDRQADRRMAAPLNARRMDPLACVDNVVSNSAVNVVITSTYRRRPIIYSVQVGVCVCVCVCVHLCIDTAGEQG